METTKKALKHASAAVQTYDLRKFVVGKVLHVDTKHFSRSNAAAICNKDLKPSTPRLDKRSAEND